MFRLISHLNCPPGSFWYEQNENGIPRKWDSTPLISDLASTVANFRKANNLPRASKAEALVDIDRFTCDRLGNDKIWCYQDGKTYDEVVSTYKPVGCTTCGHS